jgi:hypothetical protein
MNSQLQNQEKEKEGFENNQQGLMALYPIAHSVIALFALFLSFKCNNGISIIDLILACCCPWLYVLYRFATGLCSRPSYGYGDY